LLGLFLLGGFGFKPLAISGTSTLSLTQANLQSSNQYLNGKVWLLTFRTGGLSQRYYGTFSPSDVQGATSDSSTTTKDFSLEVVQNSQSCNYDIQGTTSNKPIYEVQRVIWTCATSPSESWAKEKSGYSNILYYGKYFGLSCFAIGYNSQSPVGNLNSPTVETEYEISINAGGETGSKTINTIGSGQGQIGNFAYAIWQGNLVSGSSCPDKSPYIPIYVNGVWRIGDKSYYDTYRSLIASSPTNTPSSQDIWMQNVQESIVRAKQIRSFGAINSQTSMSSAVTKINLDNPIQFPVTTLYIKADTIGIYTPTPEGKIVSSTSECFKTGENGGISVGIENTGDEYGTWNLYATCQDPFTSTQSIQVSLSAKQSTTRIIPLSASSSQETRKTCTIYLESPQGVKTASVGVCVKPQITCESNKKFCDVSGTSEVIKQCSSDGATSSILSVCPNNYYCENAECKAGSQPLDLNIFQKIGNFFSNLFSGIFDIFTILKIVVVIIAFIFTLLFSLDLLQGFKSLKGKSKNVIRFLIGLFLALAIAILVFSLFWIGVILFVVFIIIKIALGFIKK